MHATWYSFGFLNEPRTEIREAVGIQFDLSTCQACNKHVDATQSPRWTEEEVWHCRWSKGCWVDLDPPAQQYVSCPSSAGFAPCSAHQGCPDAAAFSYFFLSSMQKMYFRCLSEFHPRKQSYLKKSFTYTHRLAATYGEVEEEVGSRGSRSEVELQGIFLGWCPAFLTKFQISSREDKDWRWCWLHTWGFSKTPLTALDDGEKE